jgi:hypothetical protein
MSDTDVIAGPPPEVRVLRVLATITVIDANGWVAHEEFSVAVAPQFLHNLGGIAADETARSVATLIRKIGDATGKRSGPVAVEDHDD